MGKWGEAVMFIGDVVLRNESDVEQKFIMPLLNGEAYLNIPLPSIYPKQYLAPTDLDKVAGKTSSYIPDYSIWFRGLPTMIVEAKSPDVESEVGYREACLYARHLNQRFPADVNPCKYVLATNGKTLLFGSWDSHPLLTLAFSDIRIGTNGLQALQSHCSGAALDELAHSFSKHLRTRKFTVPYNLMGGQPVLNAKRALNNFAADLSPILRLYFSSMPQENIHEIAEEAYVSSNEITEYDRVLESLLKDRLSIREPSIVKPLKPTRRGETNIAKTISSFDQERPIHGQLQIIQGPVGSGKSLFIRRYKDVLEPASDAARTKWAILDFNNATKADLSSMEGWIFRAFVDAFQSENPAIDLTSADVLRGVFARNFQRRSGVYVELAKASQAQAAIQRAQDLAKWQDDPMELTKGIADYVVGSRHEILVTVMDNVDRLDLESQLNSFQVTLSFMALTKCLVILQMRDETYERFKDKRPLDTYRSGIIFHIGPPRFIDVVKKRLELSLAYLTREADKVQRYSLESGVRVRYPKEELAMFLHELYTDLFERRHNISRILEALAGWDVRRALEMFVSVITSGHLSAATITSNIMGGTKLIREHTVLKILMRTDYRFASDQSGYTTNIFGFDEDLERPDNFLIIEILYFLNISRKKRGEIGLEGYFTCRRLADELQRFGYVPQDVLVAINYLVKRQLITADHLSLTARVEFTDSVRILASGFMHLRVMPERLEYLYGVLPTTPFTDSSIAEGIVKILEHERAHDDVAGSEKSHAVHKFQKYLGSEEHRLRSGSGFVPSGETGAKYVLQKIDSCLRQFTTRLDCSWTAPLN